MPALVAMAIAIVAIRMVGPAGTSAHPVDAQPPHSHDYSALLEAFLPFDHSWASAFGWDKQTDPCMASTAG